MTEELIVKAFVEFRERCEHYHGIKDNDLSLQCSHPDQRSLGDWCGLTCCPRLAAEASKQGVE